VYPNVGAAGCTLTSGQPGAAWSGQEVCSGFALAARASPSRLGLRPSRLALRARGSLYEFVLYNSYKILSLYEIVLYNSYKKLSLYEFVIYKSYKKLYELVQKPHLIRIRTIQYV
jgi:hypothetical protein